MAGDSLPDVTTDQLTRAAIRLVDAIVDYRENGPRGSTVPVREPEARGSGFAIMTMGQLTNTPDDVLHARDIVSRPVIYALKTTLKEIGQMIYDRVGSTEKLLAIADVIAGRDGDKFGQRMAPIDSAWNGVGAGNDRWQG